MRYNREEKIFITKKYTILRSATLVQRAWRSKFTVSNAPGRSTILNLAKKFHQKKVQVQGQIHRQEKMASQITRSKSMRLLSMGLS